MSVYFARRDSDDLIKIGWSRSVKIRMASVQGKVIGAIPGERDVEKIIHAQFDHLREEGEWFRPGDDLLEYIRTKAQSHKPDTEMVQTAFKLEVSMLDRMDRLAEQMSQPGLELTRTDMARLALHRGLSVLEAERQKDQ